MKNAKWILPVTVLLLSSLMVAQSLTRATVTGQVPFDFVAGNQTFPAGKCVVNVGNGNVLAIHNYAAHKSTLVASSHADTNQGNDTVLVFAKYNSQYFLSEIRVKDSSLVYKVPASRAEIELRAQSAPASQVTLLAASQ
jgi:hypothetical protein